MVGLDRFDLLRQQLPYNLVLMLEFRQHRGGVEDFTGSHEILDFLAQVPEADRAQFAATTAQRVSREADLGRVAR